MNNSIGLKALDERLFEIEQALVQVSVEPSVKTSRARTYLEDLEGFSKGERYFKDPVVSVRRLGLVNPIQDVEGGDYKYSRENLRDIVVIDELKRQKLSNTEIACLFLDRMRQICAEEESGQHGKQAEMLKQSDRAITTLRSRFVGYLLVWLLDEQAPEGTIIHMRKIPYREKLTKSATRIIQRKRSFKQVLQSVGEINHSQDLTGRVTSEGEILIKNEHIHDLRFQDQHSWHEVIIQSGRYSHSHQLTLGLSKSIPDLSLEVPSADQTIRKETMALLAETCLLSEERYGKPKYMVALGDSQRAGYLSDLVDVIPELSSDWQYAAVYITSSNNQNRLAIAAKSHDFPPDIPDDIEIEVGQPQIGWAFSSRFPIKIEDIYQNGDDPRTALQSLEKATAAIALPIRAGVACNGVLYVGTKKKVRGANGGIFRDAQLLILELIADVIGEIVERNNIRTSAELNSIRKIKQPLKRERGWSEFGRTITNYLSDLTSDSLALDRDDNLHIVAVKIKTSEILREDDEQDIAIWIEEHLQTTVYRFYSRKELGNPIFFNRHNRTGSEFVCLLRSLKISSEDDRRIRAELRTLLRSVVLRLSFEESKPIEAYLWSMPFRRTILKWELSQTNKSSISVETRATEIVRETEEALDVIELIEEAHLLEKTGSHQEALERYKTAHYRAPGNTYLVRHIAKTYVALGDREGVEKSLDYWDLLLQLRSSPTPYGHLRYAFALGLLGRVEDAKEQYDKAQELNNHDVEAILEYGDLLVACRELEAGLQQYHKALEKLPKDRDNIWMRLAETYLWKRDFGKAHEFSMELFARNAENQNVKRLALMVANSFTILENDQLQ